MPARQESASVSRRYVHTAKCGCETLEASEIFKLQIQAHHGERLLRVPIKSSGWPSSVDTGVVEMPLARISDTG